MIVNKNGNQYRNAYICRFPYSANEIGQGGSRTITGGINLRNINKELGIKVCPTSKENQSAALAEFMQMNPEYTASGYSEKIRNRLIDEADAEYNRKL